ncbi:MAG: ABC transporter permease, partial [Longimicrobiaceae bacterium]
PRRPSFPAPAAPPGAPAPRSFAALGTSLVAGREFVPADAAGGTDVVIVNEVLARRLWPRGGAVGKRLRFDAPGSPPATVVGVVRVAKYRALGEMPRPAVWRDLERSPRSRSTIVVRADGDAAALVPRVRAAIAAADPALAPIGLGTLRERVSLAYVALDDGALTGLAFGVLAVLLAAAGIYGVVSYGAAQRRRELGVRAALGAGSGALARLVARQALGTTAAGVAAGLLAVLVLPTGIERVLFGVSRTDPLALAAAVAVIAIVSAAAALIPAHRASRADPMRALRLE